MIWKALLNVIGIGGDALKNRAKIKQAKQEQDFEVIKAQTDAKVHVIKSQADRELTNDEADNRIDWENTKQKANSWKDEVITYLTITPFAIAVFTPFIIAYKGGDWTELNTYMKDSFASLSGLPAWYKWVLAAVIVDVLAFRRIFFELVKKSKGFGIGKLTDTLFKKDK